MSDNKKTIAKNIILIILCISVAMGIGYIFRLDVIKKEKVANGLATDSNHIIMQGYTAKSRYITINEVSGDGKVELYNSSTSTLSLDGVKISIQGKEPYTIESGVILPHGFFVVDLDTSFEDAYRKIYVTDADDNAITSLQIPKLEKDESYGALTDGGSNRRYMKSTINATNNNTTIIDRNKLYFSATTGFYKEAFSLEIVAPEGCKVYYTLNSERPTTASALYEKEIYIKNASGRGYTYAKKVESSGCAQSIDMATVVRAIAVNQQGEIIAEETAVYWVGTENDTEYKNMPIISLVTDPDNLFDYHTGIYVSGRDLEDAKVSGESEANRGNYYKDYTKEVYVEYYNGQKALSYAGTGLIATIKDQNVAGGQKSLVISGLAGTANTELSGYIEGSKGMLSLTNFGRDYYYKTRPQVLQALLKNDSSWIKRMTPVMVFLDGEFWGLYLMETQNSAEDICAQYGVSDIVTIIDGVCSDEQYLEEYQELLKYIVENDMSNSQNYRYVGTRIDLEQYAEYLCTNMYLANISYGNDGAVIWKAKGKSEPSDGRWHFIYGDMSAGMNNGWAGTTTVSSNTFMIKAVDQDEVLISLIQNDEFKQLLRSTMQKIIDEKFDYSKVESTVTELSESIKKAATASNERYGSLLKDKNIQQEASKINSFFKDRADYINIYLEELLLKEKPISDDKKTDEDIINDEKTNDEKADDEKIG